MLPDFDKYFDFSLHKAQILEKVDFVRNRVTVEIEKWVAIPTFPFGSASKSTNVALVDKPSLTFLNQNLQKRHKGRKYARYYLLAAAIIPIAYFLRSRIRRSRRVFTADGKKIVQVVAISDASSPLGRDLALRLAEQGFTVFACVCTVQDARDLRASSQAQNLLGEVKVHVADIADYKQVCAFSEVVLSFLRAEEGRRFTALVNCEALAHFGPLEDIPIEKWQHAIENNVLGPVALMKAFVPMLRENPDSTSRVIINISSRISSTFGLPYNSIDAASNHAMKAVNDCARRELSQFGIKVIRLLTPFQLWASPRAADSRLASFYAESNRNLSDWTCTGLTLYEPGLRRTLTASPSSIIFYNFASRSPCSASDINHRISSVLARTLTLRYPPSVVTVPPESVWFAAVSRRLPVLEKIPVLGYLCGCVSSALQSIWYRTLSDCIVDFMTAPVGDDKSVIGTGEGEGEAEFVKVERSNFWSISL